MTILMWEGWNHVSVKVQVSNTSQVTRPQQTKCGTKSIFVWDNVGHDTNAEG